MLISPADPEAADPAKEAAFQPLRIHELSNADRPALMSVAESQLYLAEDLCLVNAGAEAAQGPDTHHESVIRPEPHLLGHE